MNVTIYSTNQDIVFFKDGDIAEVTSERQDHPGNLVAFAISPQSGYDFGITLQQQQTWMLDVTVIGPDGFLEQLPLTLEVGETRSVQYTDDLGGAHFDLPQLLDEVKLVWETEPRTTLLDLARIQIEEHDLLPLFIEHADEQWHIVIPDIGVRLPFDGTYKGFLDAVEAVPDHLVEVERGRTISAKKLIKSLKKIGFEIDASRGKGSHYLASAPSGRKVPIPFHGGDLKKGTLNGILSSLGVTYDQIVNA